MRIADRTPYRNSSGQVDVPGRVQGTLKYGLSWYPRVQAESFVITVLNKSLGQNFILLRNITLPDSSIDLPLVLIGPPGIFMINVAYERGVFIVRDDEWGKMAGEIFVPARINLVQRTVKLARVLQIYLERNGYKYGLLVEPVLMAAYPGIHIDSTRPAARIVLNDALERFALSLSQASPVLNVDAVAEIGLAIAKGPKKPAPGAPGAAVTTAKPASPKAEQPYTPAFTADSLDFSFDDKSNDLPASFTTLAQADAASRQDQQQTIRQTPASSGSDNDYSSLFETGNQGFKPDEPTDQAQPASAETAPVVAETQPEPESMPAAAAPKNKNRFGMSTAQILILGGILIFWCCLVAGFIYYINR